MSTKRGGDPKEDFIHCHSQPQLGGSGRKGCLKSAGYLFRGVVVLGDISPDCIGGPSTMTFYILHGNISIKCKGGP